MEIELSPLSNVGQAQVQTQKPDELRVSQSSQRVRPSETPAASQEDSSQPPSEDYPSGIRLVLITVGLILTIFLCALDSTILATAIPSITTEFHALDDVGWYSAGYAVSNAAFQSAWGQAYKHFPMKRVFLSAVALFEAGNILSGAAPTSRGLIAGRVLAGCGGAGTMTAVFIFIAFSARPEYKAAYFGVLGVTFGCASVVGPLVGGALADGIGWRWCFWYAKSVPAFELKRSTK